MILRTWRGWVSTDAADAYVRYVAETGLMEYRATSGNRGCQLVVRDLYDGRSEVITLSWWESIDNIRAFAGDDVNVAKFYPDDDLYLIDRETSVQHYAVEANDFPSEM